MMNCLDFRRLKSAQPRQLPSEAIAHANSCRACAEFGRAVDQLERRLENALRVPVEPNLASRVLLQHKLKRSGRMPLYARAAALLLVVGIALAGFYATSVPSRQLLVASVEHVEHEPYATASQQVIAVEQLHAALAPSQVKVAVDLPGQVIYLRDCPVPGGVGKHIVIRTTVGTVTLFTMPNKRVALRRSMQHGGKAVAVFPCKRGSIAMVADSAAALAAVEKLLAKHVQWSA